MVRVYICYFHLWFGNISLSTRWIISHVNSFICGKMYFKVINICELHEDVQILIILAQKRTLVNNRIWRDLVLIHLQTRMKMALGILMEKNCCILNTNLSMSCMKPMGCSSIKRRREIKCYLVHSKELWLLFCYLNTTTVNSAQNAIHLEFITKTSLILNICGLHEDIQVLIVLIQKQTFVNNRTRRDLLLIRL